MFLNRQIGRINLIKAPTQIDKVTVKVMNAMVPVWLRMEALLHVLDFKSVSAIDQETYRDFVSFTKKVAEVKSQVISVNLPLKVARQLHQDGVRGVFNPVSNLVEFCHANGIIMPSAAKPALDLQPLAPLIEEIKNILAGVLGAGLSTMGTPHSRAESKEIDQAIVGRIDLETPQFSGFLMVAFPTQTAIQVFNSVNNSGSISEVNDQVEDYFLNVLSAFKPLAKGGADGSFFPQMFIGNPASIQREREAAVILPFNTNFGAYFLEIGTGPKTDE